MKFPIYLFLQCFGIVSIMLLGFKHIFPALLASHASGASPAQVVLSDASTEQPQTGNVAYALPTERTFLLNVPAAYKHEEPHPLVLSFHGGKSPLALMPDLLTMNLLAHARDSWRLQ
jgi:poly(3-hydroxybutyrate) depolymerase